MTNAIPNKEADTLEHLQITGIDHVVFHVKDIERSKQFYIDLLGFKVDREHLGDGTEPEMEEEFDASIRSFLSCGGHQIGLFQRNAPDVGGGVEVNHVALTLANGSYEDVCRLLSAAGVEVRHRENDDRCIYISDPDGHRLELFTSEKQH